MGMLRKMCSICYGTSLYNVKQQKQKQQQQQQQQQHGDFMKPVFSFQFYGDN
jgi:hypothetical protein